jgi:isopentenyl-diphosphate delta-isomerase
MDRANEVELLDGTAMDKLAAHQTPGFLHRAFSVFVLDAEDRVLLQRRALSKYHFAGLWSNTCCSHPGPGDDLPTVAAARTRHEVGVDVALSVVGAFTYRAEDPASGLVEHEHDTVLVGRVASGTVPVPHPDEVVETRWLSLPDLRAALAFDPDAFTPWLAQALETLG